MTPDTDKARNRSTDLWIESHQQLGKHPKMLRAARLLGINRVQMVGHLQYLWWWALDFATEGDIADYDAADIADAALWDGDPQAFFDALVQCGWIDRESDQDVILHDWQDYAGKLLEGREKQAERQRRFREKQRGYRDVTDTEPEPSNKEETRNAHVTGTSPSRNGLTTTVTTTTTRSNIKPSTETVVSSPQSEVPTADAASNVTPLRTVPKASKPKAERRSGATVPGWDYSRLWQLCVDFLGYKPTWNYAIETDAVNEILKAYPNEEPEDLIRFLAWRRTGYGSAKGSQVMFSTSKQHYAAWVNDDRPGSAEPRSQTNGHAPAASTASPYRNLSDLLAKDPPRAIRPGPSPPAAS